jgi:adenine deaminase
MDSREFLRAIPKVSLHVHLEGSVQATTVVQLAAKHGVTLPHGRDATNLYEYPDILQFLEVYAVVAHLMRDHDDFRRVTYETLSEAAAHGVRYREMFWSPMAHFESGTDYATAVDGIIAGVRDAESDHGIVCRLIADIDRMQSPEAGLAMVEEVLAHPRDELIGIGLDYAEDGNPPEKFWKSFALAGRAGLHRTAHTSEDAPARNVETALDLLGVERIDHGYHVLGDHAITQRCVDQGIVFTCCPISTAGVYFGPDLTTHPIRRMIEVGLKVMIDCDDPPMFATDPTSDYVAVVEQMGATTDDVRELVLNGIDGSWLDDPTKRRWRREWAAEIDALAAQVTPAG